MQIIAGAARGIVLATAPSLAVRPTAGRSREALFNSLGPLSGMTVVDLFAGSGALGLESASRGAAEVFLVEREKRHCRVIEKNIAAVVKAGVAGVIRLMEADACTCRAWHGCRPDLIFADPPYAESAEFFHRLLVDPQFLRAGAGATLVWEIPDAPGSTGNFLTGHELRQFRIRRFGGTDFLLGVLPEPQ